MSPVPPNINTSTGALRILSRPQYNGTGLVRRGSVRGACARNNLALLKKEFDLALIFITHDLRVAAEICDRVMVMQAGEVVELGETRQIFTAPAHPYTRSLIDAIPGTARIAKTKPAEARPT
jgi:ABC-type antimicrobial peptide transport system ATPase subunit